MVTLILTRIVFVLSIPLCLYAVYFGVVALFGLRKKLPAAPQAKPEKRFALVVAARNEAAVIGHLVDSLYGQDYPRELYEVIVAPNNCTDDTEAVAAGRGARIFRPEGVIRSKGEVLTRWWIKSCWRRSSMPCAFLMRTIWWTASSWRV